MQNFKLVGLMLLGSVVLLVGGAVWFSKSAQTQTGTKPVDEKRLVLGDSHSTAPSTSSGQAEVTIVEFADFQCPACAEAAPMVKKLLAEYGDKVKLVYRHFPLNQHKHAFIAAEAAEAAGEQGKFWEMGEMLYTKQKEWENEKNPLDKFVGYAKELGLDEGKFREFVEAKKAEDKIKRDQSDGFIVGVNSTPTFFVNGYRVGNWGNLGAEIEVALQK